MKLLISVIDPLECAALSRLPDYLDVKNPSDGSLGMPKLGVVQSIRQIVGDGVVISTAIGDAVDDPKLYSERAVSASGEGADIIKVGLFDFASRRSVVTFLQHVADSLRGAGFKKKMVAAVYADRADESLIQKFPRLAREAGTWGCLIDTYDKTRGSLLKHVDLEALKRFTASCRENDVVSALAGGLKLEDFDWLKEVNPDVAGFRSAVASGARSTIGIDIEKIGRLFDVFKVSNKQYNHFAK